ncbi:hypothetical protein NTGHW29_960004 [Candidatus Nitrotoga sp. HW29]|nr:hypothetical protein NTGHW29_960004 [Candidatus Nitrotoga sp. HW29]
MYREAMAALQVQALKNCLIVQSSISFMLITLSCDDQPTSFNLISIGSLQTHRSL